MPPKALADGRVAETFQPGGSKAQLAREFAIRYIDMSQSRREGSDEAELERLRAENAKLKKQDAGGLSLKVSEKGGVSLYGLGRFPVTLYKEQWLRLLADASKSRHSSMRTSRG